jgi:tetratricopeptide (TPR) repeat protein
VSGVDQAVVELERAVEVAADVIARGERGTNDDAFVNTALARVAHKVRNEDFDGGASTIDEALAEFEPRQRRSQVTLLEEGVKVDILRRDAVAVAQRIEMIVAVDHPTDRPAWLPEFQARYDAFKAEGAAKGINFSLSVAIELARRMVSTARDTNERGIALNVFGETLRELGGRESGTARLDEAVQAHRAALQEWTREREPQGWAQTQVNLGIALARLGERERGTAQLEAAEAAFRAALEERPREREPQAWAVTQVRAAHARVSTPIRGHCFLQLRRAALPLA